MQRGLAGDASAASSCARRRFMVPSASTVTAHLWPACLANCPGHTLATDFGQSMSTDWHPRCSSAAMAVALLPVPISIASMYPGASPMASSASC